jgi:hypothetical protein
MKLLALMLLPLFSLGQTDMDKENGITVNASIGAGYIKHTFKPMGKFSLGGTYEGSHLAVNLELFATNLKSYPVIPSLTYGVTSRSWEVYGGVSYHAYSNDYVISKNDYYPIFGVLHRIPGTSLTIDASFTNQIYSLKIGLGCIR